mmetsp:Transcript_30853/g.54809  ORF Transcript_30853/g.54809 Transcript_30853/m.54809 type:complete len:168 (-) Transcript_30853:997-1500(-)
MVAAFDHLRAAWAREANSAHTAALRALTVARAPSRAVRITGIPTEAALAEALASSIASSMATATMGACGPPLRGSQRRVLPSWAASQLWQNLRNAHANDLSHLLPHRAALAAPATLAITFPIEACSAARAIVLATPLLTSVAKEARMASAPAGNAKPAARAINRAPW